VIFVQVILISGFLFYALEHEVHHNVNNIFDGLWWSVVTLTTIGYGDIAPITYGGRILGMLLALVGIGLVALPTGIITSGFVRALRSEKQISQLAEEFEEEEEEQDQILRRVRKLEKSAKTSPKTRKTPKKASQ
jgi:voltage-gated potassium channel